MSTGQGICQDCTTIAFVIIVRHSCSLGEACREVQVAVGTNCRLPRGNFGSFAEGFVTPSCIQARPSKAGRNASCEGSKGQAHLAGASEVLLMAVIINIFAKASHPFKVILQGTVVLVY